MLLGRFSKFSWGEPEWDTSAPSDINSLGDNIDTIKKKKKNFNLG
jgi:hypothetical protein